MQGIGTGAVDLSEITTYLFDLDGVLWRGDTAIEGAVAAVKRMREAGKRCLFCTNNSSHTPADYVDKLHDMGLHVNEFDVLTSSWVTAHYLSGHFTGPFLAYVVGEEGIHSSLQKIGARIVPDSDLDSTQSVDCVVVGIDRHFTYTKLHHAQRLIANGALFIATNRDASYPVEDGVAPGAGSIVAAVETASGTTPVTVGKPRPVMIDLIMQKLNLQPHEVAFVGDRLDTDIVCARRAGITAICVLTGVTTEEKAMHARGELRPHYIYETLDDLCAAVFAPDPAITSASEEEEVAQTEEVTQATSDEITSSSSQETEMAQAAPDESTFSLPDKEVKPDSDESTFSLPAEDDKVTALDNAPATSLSDDIDHLFDESKETNAPDKEDAESEAPDEGTFSLPTKENETAPTAQISTSPAAEGDAPEASLSDDIDQLFEQSKEQPDANASEDEKSFNLDTAMSTAEEKEPELPASQRPPAAKATKEEADSVPSETSLDLEKEVGKAGTVKASSVNSNIIGNRGKAKAKEAQDFDWKLD